MKTSKVICGTLASAALTALAATTITDPQTLEVTALGEVTIAPETVTVTAEPADLPTPVFHFDATRSDDWTFDAKKATVSKIPSLNGTHYMTSSVANWQIGNGSNNNALYLPSVAELGGKPAISLGSAVNTCRALWFDPVEVEDGGNVTNVIRNIGTVVAVHKMLPNSANTFMGGGWNKGSAWGALDTTCVGNNWSRDTTGKLGGAYWSPMFYGYRGPMGGNFAFHDGLKTDPTASGFCGQWEVTIFQPTEAKWEAAGIGMSVVPSMAYNRGGGDWAELYVFDQVVDEEVLQRLNVYLQKKWFGDTKIGYNGVAEIGRIRPNHGAFNSQGTTNVVDVSTGMTLTIDRLSGGRGKEAKIRKRGAGTLKVLDAAHFGGDIDMEGGRLDLTTKATPLSRADLPSGLSYAFDASDADSMTLEGDGTMYLRRWRNETTNTVASGSTVYARAAGNADSRRPILLADELGTGLNILDFGRYSKANTTDEARYMDFVYSADESTFTAFHPQSVYTVVAVMGAQRSGGNLVAGANASTFSRHQDSVDWMDDSSFTAPILRTASTKVSYATVYPVSNSCVMVNGVIADSQQGYKTPGYQVVGIRTSAQPIYFIGATESRRGGLRLGELLIWQRPLTAEEMRDAQAYLTKKWFGRDLAGYHSAGHVLADARSIVAADASEIYVGAGTTSRVEALTANATLVKRGAGTLEIGPFGKAGTGSLKIAEGEVKAVAAQDVVTDASQPAIGASLHLDAADAASIYYKPDTTTGEVRCWYDKAHQNAAYVYTSGREPIRDAENGVKLNGKPIIDLMPDDTKRYMYLATSLDGVRAAFVVWQPADGGSILGSCSTREINSSRVDFIRASGGKSLIIYNEGARLVSYGALYTNGVACAQRPEDYVPENEFQLTELYPLAGAHVSALGLDRGDARGLVRYAEIILYERELSEREKVATRNYLMKKWFGAEPQALPAATPASFTASLTYAADTTWSVAINPDGTAAEPLKTAGTLSFEDGAKLNLTGLGELDALVGRKIIIAHASGYEGLSNVAITGDVTFTAANQPTIKARANGDLVLRFGTRGLSVMVK